ncbi:hypothetical protein ENBRE01_2084, partial [Enteropsectra breve]
MLVAQILIQTCWATDQATQIAVQHKADDSTLFEDIKLNMKEINEAENIGLLDVYLPRPLPKIKQLYNKYELLELLDREKVAQGNADKDTGNKNTVSENCPNCTLPFSTDTAFENSFKEGVYKTNNQLPVCVMCPNPRCAERRICCKCVRTIIELATKPDPRITPVRYYDYKRLRIPSQKMVRCLYCRCYL